MVYAGVASLTSSTLPVAGLSLSLYRLFIIVSSVFLMVFWGVFLSALWVLVPSFFPSPCSLNPLSICGSIGRAYEHFFPHLNPFLHAFHACILISCLIAFFRHSSSSHGARGCGIFRDGRPLYRVLQ